MSHRVIPIRASSVGDYFDCALRWEAVILLGRRKLGSVKAWLGSSIHHGTALYDQARLDGSPIRVDDAAGEMINMLWTPDEKLERDPKFSLQQAERIALVLLSRYCSEIAPKKQYQSVEMKLEPLEIDCEDGLVLRFTGTMDRARVSKTLAGDIVDDIKSGGRLFDADGHVIVKARAAQVGIYQILKENTDGRPTAGAQITALQTSSKPMVGMSHVFNAKAQLLGNERYEGLISIMAKMMKAGVFPPNPSSSLCSKRWCPNWDHCGYHE